MILLFPTNGQIQLKTGSWVQKFFFFFFSSSDDCIAHTVSL